MSILLEGQAGFDFAPRCVDGCDDQPGVGSSGVLGPVTGRITARARREVVPDYEARDRHHEATGVACRVEEGPVFGVPEHDLGLRAGDNLDQLPDGSGVVVGVGAVDRVETTKSSPGVNLVNEDAAEALLGSLGSGCQRDRNASV